jgi:hypothetical protein
VTARWHGDGPVPAVPSGVQELSGRAQAGAEKMNFHLQRYEGLLVSGAYYKSIDKNGKPIFVSYRWLPSNKENFRNRIARLQKQTATAAKKFQSRFPSLKEKKILSGPELIITATEPVRLEWSMVLEEKDGTLLGLRLNENLRQFEVKKPGSQFGDATASLFPKGPIKSDITDVWLKHLMNPQSLESDQVVVRTESDMPALADKNQFRFASEDPRFSQVQAFFFASESLKWFAKKWNFQLPFRLEVETQKGYPSKTNTAFYFQHKIRLGEGDDVTYTRIPLDPSIVTHESIHAIVEAVAGLPYDGEGGSLNEALADYFAATQLENPHMGEASYRKEPYKRSLQNDFKKDEKNGGLYHDSLLVSGLLWNIRSELGAEVADRLAWKTLLRLTPDSNFSVFQDEFLKVVADESLEVQSQIRGICKTRGWN